MTNVKAIEVPMDSLEGEVWENIPNYDSYKISNYGRVWSFGCIETKNGIKIKKGRFLKPAINPPGYWAVCLFKNNKGKTHSIHRLVAIAFIPNPENKPQVNHINGIKTDNRIENLEWATPSENLAHAYKIGKKITTVLKGENHGSSKISNEDVLEIRRLMSDGFSYKWVSNKFGLSQSQVRRIHLRERWAHI